MRRSLARAAGITSTGQFFPERVVSNQELETILDTSDAWITTRTGIRARRWAVPGTGASDLGAQALRMALDRRGMDPRDLEVILACTSTPDHFFPSTAALLAGKVGATHAHGFDLSAACSGFLYGLTHACGLVAGGLAQRIAVVGCDVMSAILNLQDRNTAILFGDGAGAALVEPVEEGMGLLDFMHGMDPSGKDLLKVPAGGSVLPATQDSVAQDLHFVHQQGKEVYKHAVQRMTDCSQRLLDRNGLHGDAVALVVPHQANLRILEAVAKRLGIGMDRVACNIHQYANTTAGTIPTALHQCVEEGRLHAGDLVLFTAFGGGFTYGSALLRWALP